MPATQMDVTLQHDCPYDPSVIVELCRRAIDTAQTSGLPHEVNNSNVQDLSSKAQSNLHNTQDRGTGCTSSSIKRIAGLPGLNHSLPLRIQ